VIGKGYDMSLPGGPCRFGGREEYVIPEESSGEGWAIRAYPDVMQSELEKSGQQTRYYWQPTAVRLAQFPDSSDYKFSHVQFAGALTEDANVGVETELETVGGLPAFTTTTEPPLPVMEQVRERLKDRIRGERRPAMAMEQHRAGAEPHHRPDPREQNVDLEPRPGCQPDAAQRRGRRRQGPWSVGLAFKLVRKEIDLPLRYEEELIFNELLVELLELRSRLIGSSPPFAVGTAKVDFPHWGTGLTATRRLD
jgi:hypothetical protein